MHLTSVVADTDKISQSISAKTIQTATVVAAELAQRHSAIERQQSKSVSSASSVGKLSQVNEQLEIKIIALNQQLASSEDSLHQSQQQVDSMRRRMDTRATKHQVEVDASISIKVGCNMKCATETVLDVGGASCYILPWTCIL